MGAPLVTIDGPSGSGKGTVCQLLARRLGWQLLDSGALYRLVGIAADERGMDLDDGDSLARLAANLDVRFVATAPGEPVDVLLDGRDVSSRVRAEGAGKLASKVAVHSAVRDALLALQRSFADGAGLVADGRDMGTVVFPGADAKFFLTASAGERARRRYKQLKNKGLDVNLATLLEQIEARDRADSERRVSPLKPAPDAVVLDSTDMDVDQVLDQVMQRLRDAGLVT